MQNLQHALWVGIGLGDFAPVFDDLYVIFRVKFTPLAARSEVQFLRYLLLVMVTVVNVIVAMVMMAVGYETG